MGQNTRERYTFFEKNLDRFARGVFFCGGRRRYGAGNEYCVG